MGRTTLIFKKSLFYKILSYFYTVGLHFSRQNEILRT